LQQQAVGWDGPPVEVMLVCGADLVESFSTPGVWVPEMLREMLSDFGVVCVAREGTDLESVLSREVRWVAVCTTCLSEFSAGLSNCDGDGLIMHRGAS